MRRLTSSYKRWLAIRARSEKRKRQKAVTPTREPRQRKRIVDAWTGDRYLKVLVRSEPTKPPKVLCLDRNANETLEYFDKWRNRSPSNKMNVSVRRLSWLTEPRNGRGLKSIRTYYDYAGIESISTAAAVIIAAEYERMAQIVGSPPPTINLHEWSDTVFNKLFELGFFGIVGLTEDALDRYHDDGMTRTMHILSGTNAEGNDRAAVQLLELSTLITEGRGLSEDIVFALNSALSEAMINVARHAYPTDHAFSCRHIGKWWVTAEADRVRKTLTIVIYDQGATIPVTLPRKKWSHMLADRFASFALESQPGDFDHDSAYIASAMDVGTTQTGEAFHGYGIPQMKELIDICGRGRLSIFSRGGRCDYDPSSNWGIKRSTYLHSIGGTLIEWVIELPEAAND